MDAKKLLYVDRRVIYLLVAIGALIPIIRPIGLPTVPTEPVWNLFNRIEELGPDDAVIISFDYGPSSEPELNPMAQAILRHCFQRRVKVLVMALFPLGGVNMAIGQLDRIASEFDGLEYGVDYVNLGYKDGAQAAMKRMDISIEALFPSDVNGDPIADMPVMAGARNYDDVSIVISLATGIIGEYWVNLVNAQFGVPVAVGCTAVSAPKYYAYLRAGQMMSLLGGLKGGSEYEKLLVDKYDFARELYETPEVKVSSAMAGMDVQSIVHLIIIVFIIFGNAMYFLMKKQEKEG
ncbi:MAG: hypothetical protein PVF95_13325 [bacterium]|jgi:hypothetical protein